MSMTPTLLHKHDADPTADCTMHPMNHHLLQWDVSSERHTFFRMPKKGSALHLAAGLSWLSWMKAIAA